MPTAKLYPSLEVIKKINPKPTEGEKQLIQFLLKNYGDEYEIFFQPFLNGDLPDIILMRKDGGVIIFEVKDWNLNNYEINDYGKWIVKNNKINNNTPLSQVLKYKENLYNLHIDSLLELKLRDYKYWYIVNCVVYFHCSTEKEANEICYGKSPSDKYKKFLDTNFKVFETYCYKCKKYISYKEREEEQCKCGKKIDYKSLILGRDSLNKRT
ncbi:MAG: nuclease-related domain-containing protein, partial [Flavobacteriaceae bacterium]|nr:nuclease-related domain-containing protein [Flavobacteriaceae bacterium]